jgi:hypothetical protein
MVCMRVPLGRILALECMPSGARGLLQQHPILLDNE